ncbi:MAG: CPBP family intramembrane metalloprotease [Muribaculaceae bacterium]|nr:CPBP family intramembrane metalloprotease [Muribaculaceae bacterium]
MTFNVSARKRFLLFFCTTVLCMIVGSVAVAVITHGGADSPARLRCATVIQDVVMFMAPPLVTAIMITRQPADFLMIRRAAPVNVLLGICGLIAAIPAMNAVIAWNEGITLPPAMDAWMRSAEGQASAAIRTLMGGTGAGALIMLWLVAGVLAGLSEELFFRGGLQRILITARINPHVAIWVTAIIFSAVHMQFFGFVPRMLLGAYFGYLAWWSGSLWMSVAAHVSNNLIAATGLWLAARNGGASDFDSIGVGQWGYIAVSIVITALIIYQTKRLCKG